MRFTLLERPAGAAPVQAGRRARRCRAGAGRRRACALRLQPGGARPSRGLGLPDAGPLSLVRPGRRAPAQRAPDLAAPAGCSCRLPNLASGALGSARSAAASGVTARACRTPAGPPPTTSRSSSRWTAASADTETVDRLAPGEAAVRGLRRPGVPAALRIEVTRRRSPRPTGDTARVRYESCGSRASAPLLLAHGPRRAADTMGT